NAPICGKDFKTGQTLIKTILAPGLKARMLGLAGWFSTNILGNRDGEVLDDPGSFKTKEESKLSVLEHIQQPDLYPDLYGKFYSKSPMTAPGLYPEHDLFIQSMKLKNTLRHLKGEELITHLGLEYYD